MQQTNSKTLGERLRELRESRNLVQREVGAVINVDGAFISKIEKNEKPINRNHLKKLSVFFNTNEDELQILWLMSQVFNVVKDEKLGIVALENVITILKSNNN